ncbi:MAG: hypothetical protein AAGL98_07675, partial [Planctomycetota bacterium]
IYEPDRVAVGVDGVDAHVGVVEVHAVGVSGGVFGEPPFEDGVVVSVVGVPESGVGLVVVAEVAVGGVGGAFFEVVGGGAEVAVDLAEAGRVVELDLDERGVVAGVGSGGLGRVAVEELDDVGVFAVGDHLRKFADGTHIFIPWWCWLGLMLGVGTVVKQDLDCFEHVRFGVECHPQRCIAIFVDRVDVADGLGEDLEDFGVFGACGVVEGGVAVEPVGRIDIHAVGHQVTHHVGVHAGAGVGIHVLQRHVQEVPVIARQNMVDVYTMIEKTVECFNIASDYGINRKTFL